MSVAPGLLRGEDVDALAFAAEDAREPADSMRSWLVILHAETGGME